MAGLINGGVDLLRAEPPPDMLFDALDRGEGDGPAVQERTKIAARRWRFAVISDVASKRAMAGPAR